MGTGSNIYLASSLKNKKIFLIWIKIYISYFVESHEARYFCTKYCWK